MGKHYVLQGRPCNPERVSREIFANAISQAAHRERPRPGTPDFARRGQDFSDETGPPVQRVEPVRPGVDAGRAARDAVLREAAA